MFRSKKDVDRHVQNVFSKLRNENEVRLLRRCAKILFFFFFLSCNVRAVNGRTSVPHHFYSAITTIPITSKYMFGILSYAISSRQVWYTGDLESRQSQARVDTQIDDGEFSRETIVTITIALSLYFVVDLFIVIKSWILSLVFYDWNDKCRIYIYLIESH